VPKTHPNIAMRVITVRPRTSQKLHDGFSSGDAATAEATGGMGDSGSGGGTKIGFSGADTECRWPS
jgi:hypothetical protein